MKKLILLLTVFTISTILNAQQKVEEKVLSERNRKLIKADTDNRNNIMAIIKGGSSGSKCDDKTFETCPGGEIYCLPEVEVPAKNISTFNAKEFEEVVSSGNDTRVKKYLLKNNFSKILLNSWKPETSKGIVDALMNGKLSIRKAGNTEKADHYFLAYNSKISSAKKHEYIGHVTLLR